MEKEPKMGIDPKIKEEINKEGWEKTDDRDEQAILIGKKEEMSQLLEKLEAEGKTADLGTYIKLHKEIVLPKEEITPRLKEKIKSGLVFYRGDVLMYVDKDGNIANVEIRSEKISSLRRGMGIQEQVEKELKELGFFKPGEGKGGEGITVMEGDEILNAIGKEIGNYKKKIEEQIREKKGEEFDF